MPTPEHVAELIHVEAVCLKVREDSGLLRPEALGRLDQPTPITTVPGSQLDEQADPSAYLFGLLFAGLGAPRNCANRPASHAQKATAGASDTAISLDRTLGRALVEVDGTWGVTFPTYLRPPRAELACRGRGGSQ